MMIHDLDETILDFGRGSGAWGRAIRYSVTAISIKADRILQSEFSTHPDFRPNIERIEIAACIEFASSALALFAMWLEGGKLNLPDTGLAEIIVTMADVRFVTQTVDRQMTIPKSLRIRTIGESLLRLAATEDQECYLHPEWLVATMTNKAASGWEHRLKTIGSMQRVADRNALLE